MKLWTIKEICELTGLSYATVLRAVKSGALESRKIGGSRRIRQEWLVSWLGFDPFNPAAPTSEKAGLE